MILTALAVLLLGLGYSSWRLVTIAPMTPALRWIVVGLWLGAFALSLVSLLLRGGLSVAVTRYTYPFSTSWIFWLLYLVLLFLALDLLRLIPQLRPLLVPSWPLAGVLGLLIVGIFAWGSYRYQHKVRVPLELTVAKQLERPIKIVGVSDLHLGYTIGREELSRWVELINAERSDLILIAGDLVDGDVRPVLEDRLAELVNQLEAHHTPRRRGLIASASAPCAVPLIPISLLLLQPATRLSGEATGGPSASGEAVSYTTY